jgi:hypothetical protein
MLNDYEDWLHEKTKKRRPSPLVFFFLLLGVCYVATVVLRDQGYIR